jgi:hypothetical protein
MAFPRFGYPPQLARAAGIMVSLRRHPAQPQLWVGAGFACPEED